MYAPIILFAYNRLDHLDICIRSLKENKPAKESHLYIFADGPKDHEDENNISKVRYYLSNLVGFKKVTIIERNINYGLAKNIIDGLDYIFAKYKKAIIIEDDLLLSPYFLEYMNYNLDLYEDSNKVASIHGYSYPVINKKDKDFFLRGADCWGWATWSSKWNKINKSSKSLLQEIKKRKLIKDFDYNNNAKFSRMLKHQINGKVDSWAIRWHASMYLENLLTLYPKKSYVYNIGNDNSGTNSNTTEIFDVSLNFEKPGNNKILEIEDVEMKFQFEKYFQALNKKNRYSKFLIRIIKKIIPKKIKKYIKRYNKDEVNWCEGPYLNWNEAKLNSSGYSDNNIFEKVYNSSKLVKLKLIPYERDSVLFMKSFYNYSIVNIFNSVGAKKNKLSILDFGGSLGSSYYQNLDAIKKSININWGIVEQEKFVTIGNKEFSDQNLSFFYNIDDCIKSICPNIALFGSSIQYIENSNEILSLITKSIDIKYLIFDRTPFNSGNKDIIVVQHVPKKIYKADYPMKILSLDKFIKDISQDWELAEISNGNNEDIIYYKKNKLKHKNLIFKRKI